jgi:hypothetical protein
MECPIGGPRCSEGYAKGNPALNCSPKSYTTERPPVPYRSIGSGGTDALPQWRDGWRVPCASARRCGPQADRAAGRHRSVR